jgi:hypothetical protein
MASLEAAKSASIRTDVNIPTYNKVGINEKTTLLAFTVLVSHTMRHHAEIIVEKMYDVTHFKF